ncbi:hypothetical protein [Parasitella parasitica]|uniref:Uncharacterized protein n=1 Tax=Parasitella parasitica TaxID=35722 RepID=A0A0B7MPT5_9FUNG|nr:hypothetical protein [Parasitella parasitica]
MAENTKRLHYLDAFLEGLVHNAGNGSRVTKFNSLKCSSFDFKPGERYCNNSGSLVQLLDMILPDSQKQDNHLEGHSDDKNDYFER